MATPFFHSTQLKLEKCRKKFPFHPERKTFEQYHCFHTHTHTHSWCVIWNEWEGSEWDKSENEYFIQYHFLHSFQFVSNSFYILNFHLIFLHSTQKLDFIKSPTFYPNDSGCKAFWIFSLMKIKMETKRWEQEKNGWDIKKFCHWNLNKHFDYEAFSIPYWWPIYLTRFPVLFMCTRVCHLYERITACLHIYHCDNCFFLQPSFSPFISI